jgi:integrase
LRRARKNLVDFFTDDTALSAITLADAEQFRRYLRKTMADNTVRRICGRAKQFFRYAARKKLIAESPFADMRDTAVRANKSRAFYISREMADRVIDACPDAQWRLLFALSRYGGLRCPSEHLLLRWSDVDWARKRMTIHSPKTEHHEGKESRVIPIFPELRPYLEDVHALAAPGTEFVITRYRAKNSNLRTQLERIITKAGLKPWPKLFHNLRATRQTELAQTYPDYVVCEWIGNSKAVATEHYLQVTEEHFERAAALKSAAVRAAAPGCTERNGAEWENRARRNPNKVVESRYFAPPKAPRKEPSSNRYSPFGKLPISLCHARLRLFSAIWTFGRVLSLVNRQLAWSAHNSGS